MGWRQFQTLQNLCSKLVHKRKNKGEGGRALEAASTILCLACDCNVQKCTALIALNLQLPPYPPSPSHSFHSPVYVEHITGPLIAICLSPKPTRTTCSLSSLLAYHFLRRLHSRKPPPFTRPTITAIPCPSVLIQATSHTPKTQAYAKPRQVFIRLLGM